MTTLALLAWLAAAESPAGGDPATSAEGSVQTPSPEAGAPSSPPADGALAAVEAPPPDRAPSSAAELLELARDRIYRADHEGARIVLEQARTRPDAKAEEIAYLTGVSYELGGDPARALAIYEETLAAWPAGARREDLRFRRAEATGTLGRYTDALALLDEVEGDLPANDRLKVDLVRGIWMLQAGKRKKGRKALARGLDAAGEGEVTFYQAKARAALAADLLAEAQALPLDGSERRQRNRLEARARLLKAAEKEVTEIALLKEPEWIFDGLLSLGRAYEQLADALAAAPKPDLTEEQQEIYADAVGAKVEILLVKAERHYARGTELAGDLQWTSKRVDALHAAREAVKARIDGA